MRAREHKPQDGRRSAIPVLALVATLSLAVIPSAAVAKKKKKAANFATGSISATIAPGNSDQLTAGCAKKTHATGGGYTVVPSFTPPSSGSRTYPSTSFPSGATGWTSAATALTSPAVLGTFTSFVRCEKDSFAKALGTLSGTDTVQLGQGGIEVINCPPGTHVLNGGYQTSGPPFPSSGIKRGAEVLQSQRTGTSQWTVQIINPSAPIGVAPQAITVYATCEKGGKAIGEVSSTALVLASSRAAVDPSCGKGQHVVSAGFSIAPTGPPTVPAVNMDENLPVGQSGWHFGLYTPPVFNEPAGTTLTGTAYCRSNKPPKRKHK